MIKRDFEWRAALGHWRWLMLGGLGIHATACGGRAEVDEGQPGPGLGTNENEVEGSGVHSGSGGGHPVLPGYGGTSSVAGSSGVGGTGSVVVPPRPAAVCEAPVSLGGGWVQCASGLVHRAALGTCPSHLPRPLQDWAQQLTLPDAGGYSTCREDADCADQPYGHCELSSWDQLAGYCAYGCRENADCDPGYTCLCGPDIGQCHPASCSTDAHCGPGYFCANYDTNPGCGGVGFACQTAADECSTASDCAVAYCTLEHGEQGARRVCSDARCAIGRPFLIQGEERLAPAIASSAWCSGDGAAVEVDDEELARELSRRWLEQGLMEHASVAAFARFALQLLSLGAPPELVGAAGAAMQDEIRHARDCFELARHHGGGARGPGPLPLEGALDEGDLESIVIGTVLEGCIGETVAAVEAAEALAHCRDEHVGAVLAQISGDEARHAELAWRFVAWALEQGSSGLRERVRAVFEREASLAVEPAAPLGAFELSLAAHGQLPDSVRRCLRQRVLREVVAPCAEALLGAPAPNVNTARGPLRHEFHPPRQS